MLRCNACISAKVSYVLYGSRWTLARASCSCWASLFGALHGGALLFLGLGDCLTIERLAGIDLFAPFLQMFRQFEVICQQIEQGIGHVFLELFEFFVLLFAVAHLQR